MGAAIPHGLTNSLDQNVLLDLRASDGTPATGITYSDVTLKTIFDDDADNPTTETLVDGTLGSFVSNGFKEAAAGGYQYSIPNARVATAGKRFTIEVSGSGILTKRFRVIVYDAGLGFGNPTYLGKIPRVDGPTVRHTDGTNSADVYLEDPPLWRTSIRACSARMTPTSTTAFSAAIRLPHSAGCFLPKIASCGSRTNRGACGSPTKIAK